MEIALVILAAIAAGIGLGFAWIARRKNIDIILVSSARRRRAAYSGHRHVFFCFVDHYEPLWAGADEARGLDRVEIWQKGYAKAVDPFRDDSGRPPQHTFFYPEEEYRPQYLDMLGELVRAGYGDVEVHLHHDNDTSDGFKGKLLSFTEILHDRHGFLRKNPATGLIEYAFIHGNFALDDSGVDGRWCGVKDEITILRDTGCYADFTYPSAPSPTQPPTINQFYYCTDDPKRAKSHHRGKEVVYGASPRGDLLMITGPLAINWRQRRKAIFPAVENADIRGNYPATPDRIDLWLKTGIAVKGWPNWNFIKIHTHGTQEATSKLLFGNGFEQLYGNLLGQANDGRDYTLHFVTARELYMSVKALESGDLDRIRQIEGFSYEP